MILDRDNGGAWVDSDERWLTLWFDSPDGDDHVGPGHTSLALARSFMKQEIEYPGSYDWEIQTKQGGTNEI